MRRRIESDDFKLLPETFEIVSGFLDVFDTIQLSMCSKSLHAKMAIHPSLLKTRITKEFNDNGICYKCCTPLAIHGRSCIDPIIRREKIQRSYRRLNVAKQKLLLSRHLDMYMAHMSINSSCKFLQATKASLKDVMFSKFTKLDRPLTLGYKFVCCELDKIKNIASGEFVVWFKKQISDETNDLKKYEKWELYEINHILRINSQCTWIRKLGHIWGEYDVHSGTRAMYKYRNNVGLFKKRCLQKMVESRGIYTISIE